MSNGAFSFLAIGDAVENNVRNIKYVIDFLNYVPSDLGLKGFFIRGEADGICTAFLLKRLPPTHV